MKESIVARSSIVLGLAAALSIGCSLDASETDESESEYRKKPKATENWSSITVELPTGSCQPGGTCSRPLGAAASVTLDGKAIALGAANRVAPGDHTLVVNGVGSTIKLVAGKSRTLTLPTAHRKCTAANLPTVTQTDFGSSVSIANAACPSSATLVASGSGNSGKPAITLYKYDYGCPSGHAVGTLGTSSNGAQCTSLTAERVYSVNVNGRCVDLTQTRADGGSGINPKDACNLYVGGDTSWVPASSSSNQTKIQDYDLAFVPGEYSVAIGSSTKTFKLKEGDTSEIAFALPVEGSVPGVFSTNISFADARELPDASTATITSSCSGDRSYSLPATTRVTQKHKAFAATNCVYTFAAAGRTEALSQTRTNAIKLQRLDVDDVEITREDGTTAIVGGTYELFFGGVRVAGPFNTNTGIDVLPGTYELVTSFSTADGPQKQRDTLTL